MTIDTRDCPDAGHWNTLVGTTPYSYMKGIRLWPRDSSYRKTAELKMMRESVTTGRVRDWMLSRKGIIVSRWVLVGLLVVSFLLLDAGRAAGQTIDPKALEALYSLDFDVAEGKFLQLTEEDPTNPNYWNLLASSIWLKIVYETGEDEPGELHGFQTRDERLR